MLQDHKIIQVGRVLGRFLVQPLKQSKVSSGQAQSLRALSNRNLKGWQWHNLLHCLTHDEKVFPYIQSKLLISIYPCCFLSSACAHWTAWLHHLDNLPVGAGRLLLGSPQKPSLAQAEQAWFPQPFLTGQMLQPPAFLVAFC